MFMYATCRKRINYGGINLIKIKKENIQNLPCHIGRIDAIAYNGYEFSLLTPNQKAIVKLDQCLCPIETLTTCRKYHCLCFDEQKHCYWAMCTQRLHTLFMLDEKFCEIEVVKLPRTSPSLPCAISCSPCCDEIMILYTDVIVQVNIYNKEYRCIPIEHNDIRAFDVLALTHGYVVAYLQDHRFMIDVTCNEFKDACSYCIPDGFSLEGMYQCNYVQTSSCCVAYEINLILCDMSSREQYMLPIQIICNNEEESCECDGEEACECHEENPCECHGDESCECHDHVSICQCGIYEILHSIALEEAGLAHILNAEGEKIQKAIANDASVEELLRVNASVSKTISKVTILEGQLIAKLENVLCFCEDDNACKCECECKCRCDICSKEE